MTLLIALLIIVYLLNCQDHNKNNNIPTLAEVQATREKCIKEHQDSMKLYDELYKIRQERHNKFIETMKALEQKKKE
jgi:hypothetical protein